MSLRFCRIEAEMTGGRDKCSKFKEYKVGLWGGRSMGKGAVGGGFHLYGVTLELIKEVELSDEGCMFRTWEEGMKTERMGRKSYSVDKQITE